MTRFGQEIQNYAENTTAHGFRYIGQRGASLVSRVFWISVIVSGFSLVGYLAQQSFADWSSSPVITTIDSVSASIRDLPFPTVTICPKLDTNQFAYPEMVANEHKFNVKLEEAQEIWKDFGFMKEKIIQNIESHLARRDVEGIPWPRIDEEFKFRNSVITWLFQNQTTPEKLYQKLRQSIGHDVSFKKYIRQLEKIYGKFKKLPPVQTHVEERRLNHSMGEADLFYKKGYLISGQIGFLKFGQLLSKFSHLFGQSFQREVNNKRAFKARECSLLTSDEIKIHDYYASLAKALGFNNMSLYELPRLAHPPSVIEMNMATFRDNSPYTSCNQTKSEETLDKIPVCSTSMFKYAAGISKHPCIGKELESKCCDVSKGLGGLDNLANLMRVMRYARHLSPSQDNFTRFFEPFFNSDVEQQLKYPFHHFHSGYFKSGRLALNPHTAIPICRFDDGQTVLKKDRFRTPRACRLIQPVITNRGMCMAFNSDSLTSLFNTNEYLQIMREVFATELERDLPIFKSIRSGDHVGFTAFLDQRIYLQPDIQYSPKMDYGNFIIGFNPSWKSFNMRSKTSRLRIGYETEVLITPFELRASERLRDLSIAQRRCRFPDELPRNMTFFKRYSQDGCQFECLLKAATRICLCTPWDYPFLVPELRDTCSMYGALCFDEILQNVTENAKCSCVADCSDVQYRFTEKEWPVDVTTLCHNKITTQLLMILKIVMGFYPTFLYKYDAVVNNVSFGSLKLSSEEYGEFCRRALKHDFAILTVRLDSNNYQKALQTTRISLTDKIANIGGTLGLFTGMSFLSVIEIIFWMLRFFFKSINPTPPTNLKKEGTFKTGSTRESPRV